MSQNLFNRLKYLVIKPVFNFLFIIYILFLVQFQRRKIWVIIYCQEKLVDSLPTVPLDQPDHDSSLTPFPLMLLHA